MAHRLTIGCVCLVVIVLCGSPAIAQNMVSNGDFDINVAGWTPYDISFDWDASDWAGEPTSGSGLVTNDADGSMHSGPLTCVDGVVAGQSYDLGGMIRIPTGQAGVGSAYFGFYWYSGPGCSGTQTWADATPWISTTDNWIPLTRWNIVAPPGTQSAWVGNFNAKSSAGTDPYLSYHDGVYFGVFGGIFADGFETGSAYEWSAIAP